MKKFFSIFAAVLFVGSMFAGTVELTNANIVGDGTGADGYKAWTVKDDANRSWNAYAIKKAHSKATSENHFLQIKKSDASTQYYIQVPELDEPIQTITMTVSNTNGTITGGGNSATVFFSASNMTSTDGDGVAYGTGKASVTIDATDLNLKAGYITAGAAVRIWDVTITTGAYVPPTVEKPVFSVAAGKYTEAQSIELSCATEGAKIYYTLDGTDPTAESTEYTAAIQLIERGSHTIKAIAIKGEDKSKIVEATYVLNLPWIFASLEELVAAELPTNTDITVSFADVKITKIYATKAGFRYGIYLDVQLEEKDIEIFYNAAGESVQVPEAWAEEGTVSGTIVGKWTYYSQNSQWEIIPAATDWTWEQLTYKGSATAIENTEAEVKAVKFYENGQLVIIKNGVKYNALGVEIR